MQKEPLYTNWSPPWGGQATTHLRPQDTAPEEPYPQCLPPWSGPFIEGAGPAGPGPSPGGTAQALAQPNPQSQQLGLRSLAHSKMRGFSLRTK